MSTILMFIIWIVGRYDGRCPRSKTARIHQDTRLEARGSRPTESRECSTIYKPTMYLRVWILPARYRNTWWALLLHTITGSSLATGLSRGPADPTGLGFPLPGTASCGGEDGGAVRRWVRLALKRAQRCPPLRVMLVPRAAAEVVGYGTLLAGGTRQNVVRSEGWLQDMAVESTHGSCCSELRAGWRRPAAASVPCSGVCVQACMRFHAMRTTRCWRARVALGRAGGPAAASSMLEHGHRRREAWRRKESGLDGSTPDQASSSHSKRGPCVQCVLKCSLLARPLLLSTSSHTTVRTKPHILPFWPPNSVPIPRVYGQRLLRSVRSCLPSKVLSPISTLHCAVSFPAFTVLVHSSPVFLFLALT
jgi:hypothetical protein